MPALILPNHNSVSRTIPIQIATYIEARINEAPLDDEEIEDNRLRLIFTCCHPALPPEGQVALTLGEICGLPCRSVSQTGRIPEARAEAARRQGARHRRTVHQDQGAHGRFLDSGSRRPLRTGNMGE
jgi:predicted RNA polymerase sigma factor